MARIPTQFEIDVIFEKIWETWPNKDKENASKKALGVLLKSGEVTINEIVDVCRAYVLETEGDEFTYQLNNFINQDHWRDIAESINIEKLEAQRNECLEVIDSWNKACKHHWCKSFDYSDKIPLTKKALFDKLFKSNWKQALEKASKIFAKEFREGDPRKKIILSLRWFLNVSSKHTVMRLMEGEFGSPDRDISKNIITFKDPTEEERLRVLEMWRKIKNGEEVDEENPSVKKVGEECSGEVSGDESFELY